MVEAAGVLSCPELRGRKTLDDPGVLEAAAEDATEAVGVVFLFRALTLVLGKSFSASLSS